MTTVLRSRGRINFIRKELVRLSLCVCLFFALRSNAQQPEIAGAGDAGKPVIISFDVPGAGTAAQQGTIAISISAVYSIAGTYRDSNTAYHGFVRAVDGAITTFDAPDAGTGAYRGTVGASINKAGAIT